MQPCFRLAVKEKNILAKTKATKTERVGHYPRGQTQRTSNTTGERIDNTFLVIPGVIKIAV